MTLAWELADSLSGSVTNEGDQAEQEEITRHLVIGQVLNYRDLRARVEPFAPRYATDLIRGTYWVRRRLDFRGLGNRYFDVLATYATLLPQTGLGLAPSSIAWDTTGNTERIYQARTETVYPEEEPGFDKAINVSGDAIEGLDVPRPGMKYSETWLMPTATAFDDDYMGAVHRLTATVNEEAFRAFEPGEALFLGARCQWSGDTPFAQITYEFDCRPNVEDYTVGDLDPFEKQGWEYVWFRYADAVETNSLVKRVRSAHKNGVFEADAWGELLIVNDEEENPRRVGAAKTPNLATPAEQADLSALQAAFRGSFS
jgi:hypothetical protein